MDLTVKGRGLRITDQIRRVAEHKLSKIERMDPRVLRVTVEIIEERNPRINGSHRIEVAAEESRKVFRARGEGQDVDSALDQVIDRLERQISEFRRKVRDRHRGRPPGAPPPVAPSGS